MSFKKLIKLSRAELDAIITVKQELIQELEENITRHCKSLRNPKYREKAVLLRNAITKYEDELKTLNRTIKPYLRFKKILSECVSMESFVTKISRELES